MSTNPDPVQKPAHWHQLPLSQVARLAPVQLLHWPLLTERGISVAIKREDLLHPYLGGNKFYKLHGHLQQHHQQQPGVPVLSFGGAYSNHLYALAAAGRTYGFDTVGVVRGERPQYLSPTLADAQGWGMRLHFVSRQAYRQKHSKAFLTQLQLTWGRCHVIPEGAGDITGAKGCAVWAQGALALAPWEPTAICLPVGTGGTLAGVLGGSPQIPVFGFSVLKGRREEQMARIAQVTNQAQAVRVQTASVEPALPALHLESDYDCGGYARFPAFLQRFVSEFEQQVGVPLEPVYTAKLLWGVAQKVVAGHFAPGSRLLLLHTGGIQGRRGYPELLPAPEAGGPQGGLNPLDV